MHQKYHSFLGKAMRHRTGCPAPTDPRGQAGWRKWWGEYSDNNGGKKAAMEKIRMHLREATDSFAKSNSIKGLTQAFDDAWMAAR
jgi:hypothetical protein